MERVTSVGVTAKHSFSSPARNLVVSKNALKNLSRCQTLCQLGEAGGGKHGEFNGFFFYYCCCVCVYKYVLGKEASHCVTSEEGELHVPTGAAAQHPAPLQHFHVPG